MVSNHRAGLVALLTALMLAPAAWGGDFQRLALEFEGDFAAVLDEEGIPGGAWAIVHKGQLLRMGTRGHTDTFSGQEITPTTVFRVASVSKGFAGTLAAMLVADGGLDLAEPITRYAPDFPVNGTGRSITVGDVIGQSTGYIPHAFDNLIEAGVDLPQIHTRFGELEPICQPGTCYTYQNSAFALVEPVIETIGGAAYPTAVQQRIFTPLGMNTASIGYDAYMNTGNRARPHVKARSRWHTVDVKPTYYTVNSAAGVNASILDMSQWLIAQLGHRPDVLSPRVLGEVAQPRVATPRNINRRYWRDHISAAHYGLGWRIYRFGDHDLVYHGGWVSGFRADVAYSPAHDLGLVILLNAESNAISELSTGFWARALDGSLFAEKTPEPDQATGSGHLPGLAAPE